MTADHSLMPGGVVIGHGIDLCPIERITEIRERHGERFLARVFTANERAYAEGVGTHTGARSVKGIDERLAARFAAKEAVLKALGTGLAGGGTWLDIEVTRDGGGRPGVSLRGHPAGVADRLGIHLWSLSLTHAGGLAFASAIGMANRHG